MSSSLPPQSSLNDNNDNHEEEATGDEGVETTALTPPPSNGELPRATTTHRNHRALSYPDMEYAMHSFYTIVQPGMFWLMRLSPYIPHIL
jgi:hypothetical protein